MSDLLQQSINSSVFSDTDALRRSFTEAKPFRHIAIDNFFTPETLAGLVESFPAFDEKLAINENGEVGAKAVHEKITSLGSSWRQLDKLVKGEEFRQLISSITGIPDLQYDPYYFGGGTHENRQGQGLDAHVDFNIHPVTRQHRRMNLIVYLTEEWQDEWGGSIQLHRDPYLPPSLDDIVTVTPLLNRAVIFETNEYSWHGFPRIELPEDKQHLSRKSFALYYYTDTRPAEDTGPEHSTIYVEQHLPESWHAGMVLEADQLQHAHNLIGSRDQHLKRLYENIKQLYTELNQAKDQLAVERERNDSEPLPPIAEPVVEAQLEATDQTDQAGLMEQNLAAREAEVRRLRRRITELEHSTSWRVTRPMRGLKRMISGN
jgi:hypothetical protein